MRLAVIALSIIVVVALAPLTQIVSAAPLQALTSGAHSQLPQTQPGLSPLEGSFLFTTADNGSQVIYFIAGNTRHSILPADVQTEIQLNPLWPLWSATRDQVVAYPEGAPIGNAPAGLLSTPVIGAATADASTDPAVDAHTADTSSASTSYVLRPGDNLTHIAAEYGTTIDAILAANGISNPNRIYVGQTLTIPTGDTGTATADAPDDTADAPDTSANAPDTTANAPDTTDATDAANPTTYVVKRGDSAIAIARTFGIDENALLEANGITNPNRVYIGQELTIPQG